MLRRDERHALSHRRVGRLLDPIWHILEGKQRLRLRQGWEGSAWAPPRRRPLLEHGDPTAAAGPGASGAVQCLVDVGVVQVGGLALNGGDRTKGDVPWQVRDHVSVTLALRVAPNGLYGGGDAPRNGGGDYEFHVGCVCLRGWGGLVREGKG